MAAFGMIEPAEDVVPVTLHDTNAAIYRGFMIGDISGGTAFRITTPTGQVRNLTGLVAGFPYMFKTTIMHTTGSTVASVFGIV